MIVFYGGKNEIELKHLALGMFIIIIPVIQNWKGKMRGIRIKKDKTVIIC